MKNKYWWLLGLLIGCHLFLLFNLKFTAWPEMLSYPFLRNHGYLLYKDMIHPYPPVLTMALSIVYKFFGYKLMVLKIFTWAIILANDILIFLTVKKFTKKDIYPILSVAVYLLIQPFLEGNQLWFDLAIVPFILFSIYLFLSRKYFWSGIFLGVSILIKQTTGIFLIAGIFYLLFWEKRFRKILLFLTGPVILFLILLIRLITEGAVAGFFNWTLIYPFTEWGKFPGYVQIAFSNYQFLILGLLILPVLAVLIINRKILVKEKTILTVALCLLFSLILIYPRFSFFHFQVGIAFWAILFGLTAGTFSFRKGPILIYTVLLLLIIAYPKLKSDWGRETRFWGKEDLGAAKIIKEATSPKDKVYLLGPHSGLYVLADRLPPKIWTDNFGWYLETNGVQEKIIESWRKDVPRAVFVKNPLPGNWSDLGTYRPRKIVNWIEEQKIKIWKIEN